MPEQFKSIQDAVAQFDRASDRGRQEKAEMERAEILRRFPLDKWPTMRLEEYALGQDTTKDSFCYWMEFGAPVLCSIKGGAARKHIIYKRLKTDNWYYDTKEYGSVDEAWAAVRDGFVEAFEKAKKGDWDTIDDISAIRTGAALRAKALHVYFPDQILPVTSVAHIRHYLGKLERSEADEKGWGVIRLNRALFQALYAIPEFDGWNTQELVHFLYWWTDPRETRRIVKIAPGEEAKYWDDCLREGYICVGWDEVGDLRQYDSQESFKAAFDKHFGEGYRHHKPKISEKANELWTLVELEPGDIIVANKGTSKVVGVGEVVEPAYEWNPDRKEYKHIVHVKWDPSYAQDIEPQNRWALVTVGKVPANLYETIMDKKGFEPVVIVDPIHVVEPVYSEITDALERKGQVILYGPPGTGKTFTARRFAVWWLMRKLSEKDYDKVFVDRDAFEKAEERLTSSRDGKMGHLTNLTFHASYSYEDFIEGLRPVDTGSGSLALKLEAGIFKRICREAQNRPTEPFLLLIDEINRANIAKVFGEIITLLEKDKRGVKITLPQSKETFTIPANVYVIATMNTADRSIKLLDSALRRRFAFLELMPDLEPLRGARCGNLHLDEFLEELNRRIARQEGREKQIGHSYLLDNGEPITDAEEFARRFRQEILPLLQEYCYDEYASLAGYIGEQLVDREAQILNMEKLADSDQLLSALEEEFRQAGVTE